MKEVERLRALRKSAASHEIEALLVTHLPDVRYLCGFTGSNAALAVTASKAVLFTDGRYTTQAKAEVKGAKVVIAKGSALKEACAWLESSAAAAGFDPANTSVSQLEMMRAAISGKARRKFFQPLTQPLAADLRMVKDDDELRAMTAAAKLGNRVFEAVLAHLKPGVPETEIAAGLEFFARSMGAEAMSFETIVASGTRSALPHGRASSQKLPRKGFITLDFGVILRGYCSDMTRTVHLGKATAEERHAYESVLAAQEAAVAAVRPGVTCGEVDEAARSILRKAGLAKFFTHSTGHGVGLEIHENPRVAAGQPQVLEPGMVITVEPGVYMPGKFGIRIEDMVAVTSRGHKVLTPVDKKLIEL
ncbi:M24 family metallopeptidase [Silvibacterium sp.]|uniref:M24 family metallopeptidase n=1 Tax=Silvibacterium sp. TaxID=1964179 RepID=UPI0039E4459A